MDAGSFFQVMKAYLLDKRPDANGEALSLDASLWELGFVDSISIVEMILFVEGVIGREIAIETSDVRSFGSIRSIYDHYVKPRADAVV